MVVRRCISNSGSVGFLLASVVAVAGVVVAGVVVSFVLGVLSRVVSLVVVVVDC